MEFSYLCPLKKNNYAKNENPFQCQEEILGYWFRKNQAFSSEHLAQNAQQKQACQIEFT